MPTISVAISTRDRPHALRACLEGIRVGVRMPSEIVVVDQSHGDDTRKLIEEFGPDGIVLTYVRHEGQGLAASQNIAVDAAKSDYVAVIDDDCVPDKTWVAEIERVLLDAPGTDLLTGRVLPLGPPVPGLYPVSSRTSTDARRLDERTAPWDVGSGNNFTVRKEIYLRIGGCDTRLGPGSPGKGGVDMDLFYRLLRAGASARYEPSIIVFHEQKSAAERMQRRPMYGYGMGACFALWAREGDVRPGLTLQWIGWRFLRMVRALLGARLRTAREEYRMVLWTIPGLLYGFRAPGLPGRPRGSAGNRGANGFLPGDGQREDRTDQGGRAPGARNR